jgi:hypothetical protein
MAEKLLTKLFKDPELGGRIILVLSVLTVLIIAILLSGPKPVELSTATPIAQSSPTPAATENSIIPFRTITEDGVETPVTTGVIVGALAVLLIIEIGTWMEIRKHPLD